ncbi:Aegerolysin-domain-containing protein [Wilcoxina mikolae CBS 423.85]|nr:Aegerolysin-domain-containing protein [Wilcoxina mikolae CBS 423.85]
MSDSSNIVETSGTVNPGGSPKIADDRAYAQWICLELNNRTTDVVMVISAVSVPWGKLYSDGDKDKEIGADKVIGQKIQPKKSFKVWSCGRENSPSGTEGTVTVTDEDGGAIGAVYWDCPWSGRNKAEERGVADGWIVNVPKVAPDGAIGLLPILAPRLHTAQQLAEILIDATSSGSGSNISVRRCMVQTSRTWHRILTGALVIPASPYTNT